MSQFSIPNQFLTGFMALSKLDEERANILGRAIEEMPIGIGGQTFIDYLSSKLDHPQITLIGRTILSVGRVLLVNEKNTDILAKEFSESYAQKTEAALDSEPIKTLERNLSILFRVSNSLRLTFKALTLLTENAQIMRGAHIITDVRIIFNDDIKQPERNAVIVHQLKFDCMRDQTEKEIFISLDSSDLKTLQNQISRAIEKEQIIRDNYNDKISFVTIQN